MKKVLTIAGSDCSGGAGIQADIKTITVHKMYAMSAITALTAQNTTGVYGIFEADKPFVENQLNCIFNDIYPDAIKIGMVSSKEIIDAIYNKLIEFKAKNIVVDPVMVATSGSKLLSDDAISTLKEKLISIATVITPNIPEAEVLCGFSVDSKILMEKAAKEISKSYKGSILIKGGHLAQTADDLLYSNGEFTWFNCEKIDNDNTHGTGCTLSSAIACNLANGLTVTKSVENAKAFISGALKSNLNLGKGSGPLNHMFSI